MSSHGWVGHSVTRVKCNEMRSLELFNAGGTADNMIIRPGIQYKYSGTFFEQFLIEQGVVRQSGKQRTAEQLLFMMHFS